MSVKFSLLAIVQWMDWRQESRQEAVLSSGPAVVRFKRDRGGIGQAAAVGRMWGMRKKEGSLGIPGSPAVVSLDLEEVSPRWWWGHQEVSR